VALLRRELQARAARLQDPSPAAKKRVSDCPEKEND